MKHFRRHCKNVREYTVSQNSSGEGVVVHEQKGLKNHLLHLSINTIRNKKGLELHMQRRFAVDGSHVLLFK